ncbi:hypothetical protein [Nocardia xishanensis]
MCSPQILAAALAEAPPHDDLCGGHGHTAGAHHEHGASATHAPGRGAVAWSPGPWERGLRE